MMNTARKMYDHFSRVASRYREVRTTDWEPVAFIAETLKHLPRVKAADVGCGDGRYDLLLLRSLNNLHLTCIDINEFMLREVKDYLRSHQTSNFTTLVGNADDLPLEANSMDCIFTFNAIHHFHFIKFVKKAAAVLKERGRIFIYTRLKSQNAQSIWGQYFPSFLEKETRLHELGEIEQWVRSVGCLELETAEPFEYKRGATVEELTGKVAARHYSTFSLYDDDELDRALKVFQAKISGAFADTANIGWIDKNVLLVLKPR